MDLKKQLKAMGERVEPTVLSQTVGKQRLMWRITNGSEVSFKRKLAEHSDGVVPSDYYRQITWDRLLCRIESIQRSFVSTFFGYFRRAVALSLIACVLLFVSFSIPIIAPSPVIEASSQTYLVIVKGNVQVRHLGGGWQRAIDLQPLRSLDVIRTRNNTEAEIHFFNSSVSRLDANTEVVIKALRSHPNVQKTGFVNLYLLRGRLWSKSVHIRDKLSRFIVETRDASVSSHQATFSVETLPDGGAEIATYDRSVDVNVSKRTQKVTEGRRVLVKSKRLVEAEPFDDQNEEQLAWVTDNIKKDKEFSDALVERTIRAAEDEAGILPSSPLYPAKLLGQRTQSIFVVDKMTEGDRLLADANKYLNEAASLFANNQKDYARLALYEFERTMRKVADKARSDDDYRLVAETLLKDKEQRFLAITHLNSELYPVKMIIKQTREFLALNDEERRAVKFEIVQDTLFEAKDLLDQNRVDLAQVEIKKVTDSLSMDFAEANEGGQVVQKEVMTKQIALAKEAIPVLEKIVSEMDAQQSRADKELLARNDLADQLVSEVEDAYEAEKKSALRVKNLVQSASSAPLFKEEVPSVVDLKVRAWEKLKREKGEWKAKQERDQKFLDFKVHRFLIRISVNKTIPSQMTQTKILLGKVANNTDEIPFLNSLRNAIDIRLRHLVNGKIAAIGG